MVGPGGYSDVYAESATSAAQGEFTWHLATDPQPVAEARRAFETWLAGAEVPDDDIADLAVVLSELASNAVAGADGTGGADIHAALHDDDLVLEVVNGLPDDAHDVRRWDLDDPLRGGGRGLMIVRAYTDTMSIDSTGGAVRVRCTRRVRSAE